MAAERGWDEAAGLSLDTDHIGMEVYKKESQICILAEGGELIERLIEVRGRLLVSFGES